MATELATAYISLVPTTRGLKGNITREISGAGTDGSTRLTSSLDGAGREGGRRIGSSLSSAFKASALVAAGVLGGAALAFKSTVDAASNLNEAQSKVNAIFGPEGQAQVDAWAAKAAEAFGQSKSQATDAIGTYGNLLTSFGLTQDQALQMSTDLTGLASDLASFNNTSVADAVDALRSGLTGETEPLKRYGVALDDASLKAKALALGIGDGKSVLTPAQKAQAAYALVMERTKNAQGDFARTSGGLANQQRILAAQFENVKAKMGTALLPVAVKLAQFFTEKVIPVIESLAEKAPAAFAKVSDWWQKEGPGIKQRAEEIFGRVEEVVGNVVAFVKENWPEIKKTIKSAMDNAREVISSAVSIVQTLWRNFGDNIMGTVKRVFPGVLKTIQDVWSMISGVFKTVSALLKGDWDGVWEGIKQVLTSALDFVQTTFDNAMKVLQGAAGIAWEVIRSAAAKAWEGVQAAVAWVLQWIVDQVTAAPDKIKTAASGMWDGLKDAFKAAINWILEKWNDLSFTLPSVEAFGKKIGGQTFGTPDIPLLEYHTGGVVPGSAGAEVPILAMAGERVLTPAQNRAYEAGLPGRRTRLRRLTAGIPVIVNQYGTTPRSVADDILWGARP